MPSPTIAGNGVSWSANFNDPRIRMKMKKIHLALDMSNLSEGGSISVLLRYMHCWQECGLDMSVYYSREVIREEIERSRLKVRLVEVCRGYPAWKTFLFRCFGLGRILRRDKVDVVYCVNFMLLCCPVPQVVHMRNLQHFVDPAYMRQFWYGSVLYEVVRDWMCHYSVSHAGRCVYVSDYLRDLAERWRGKSESERHITIHNPVSEQHLKLSQQFRNTDNHDRNLVIGVFNDRAHKDPTTFFRAVAILREKQPENKWRAVVVGGGDWRTHHAALLAELELTEYIDFPGYIPADRIAEYYAQAFCMMSTSRLESFNNTPLEAMALGCPVVISDCCAHPEVSGGAALLVEPGNADKFAEAILKLKRERDLYLEMRRRGFERVQHFLPETSGRRFAEVFEDVAKDHER